MEREPLDRPDKYLREGEAKSEVKQSKKILCPNCGHSANAGDINIQDKIAKCGSCHEVFSFHNALQSLLEYTRAKENEKTRLGRQKDIDIFEYKGELSISIINFTDLTALIAFMIAILGLLGSLIAVAKGGVGMTTFPFVLSAAMLLSFAIYRFIGWRKNKTYIDIDEQYLYIRNRPKNLQKDRIYSRDRIRQFYGKHMEGYNTQTYGSSGYFHLWMVYDGPDGEEHIKVSPFLRSRSRALYLEQELEKYLGIPDAQVPEEFRPISK